MHDTRSAQAVGAERAKKAGNRTRIWVEGVVFKDHLTRQNTHVVCYVCIFQAGGLILEPSRHVDGSFAGVALFPGLHLPEDQSEASTWQCTICPPLFAALLWILNMPGKPDATPTNGHCVQHACFYLGFGLSYLQEERSLALLKLMNCRLCRQLGYTAHVM